MSRTRKDPDTSAPLRQAVHSLTVHPASAGFTEVTGKIAGWLEEVGALDGVLTMFLRHTSASLTIQENADPDVRADLADALDRLAPEDAPYRHGLEGPDDMPAHVKAMVTATSLTIPVQGGQALLGTWQGIFLIEHRRRARAREIALHFLGTIED